MISSDRVLLPAPEEETNHQTYDTSKTRKQVATSTQGASAIIMAKEPEKRGGIL